jgi:hypothetical protein
MKSLIQYLIEKQEEKKDEKIVESSIEFIDIKSKTELENLLEKHHDPEPDKRKNTGFWLIEEAIEKDEESYAEVNGGPWNIKYTEVKYKGETVGLISYSCDYRNYENEYPSTLHICDIQTLAGHKGFLKHYFKYIENIAKNNAKEIITLRTYEKGLINVYEKYGFKKSKREINLMTKELKYANNK